MSPSSITVCPPQEYQQVDPPRILCSGFCTTLGTSPASFFQVFITPDSIVSSHGLFLFKEMFPKRKINERIIKLNTNQGDIKGSSYYGYGYGPLPIHCTNWSRGDSQEVVLMFFCTFDIMICTYVDSICFYSYVMLVIDEHAIYDIPRLHPRRFGIHGL